jgi:hypothetical protein
MATFMRLTWIYLETCCSPSEFASFVLFNEQDRKSQKGVLHLAETPDSRIAGEVIGTARTCSQKANPGPPEGFWEVEWVHSGRIRSPLGKPANQQNRQVIATNLREGFVTGS